MAVRTDRRSVLDAVGPFIGEACQVMNLQERLSIVVFERRILETRLATARVPSQFQAIKDPVGRDSARQ